MNLAILGSTGSIGTQALDVIDTYLKNKVNVIAITANKNIDLLEKQVNLFNPKFVAITDSDSYKKFHFPNVKKFQTLEEIVALQEVDAVLISVVGISGLRATIEALKRNKNVYLANKETLVAGGEYIRSKKWINKIIPIDSEHSAILQVLNGEKRENVKRIIITASGGALRDWPLDRLSKASVADVLNHPVWSMGAKVTIDSATMANKGLEIMEAYYLFGIEDILPVIHRQSIVHSMVEYIDGSIKAQMAIPDMRLPILYALTYPNRINTDYNIDFSRFITLAFEPMNYKRYPVLQLAFYALKSKGIFPAVYNAANEIAVRRFINNQICFTDIYTVIEKTLLKFRNIENPTLDDIITSDIEARKLAEEVKI